MKQIILKYNLFKTIFLEFEGKKGRCYSMCKLRGTWKGIILLDNHVSCIQAKPTHVYISLSKSNSTFKI